jgi:RNA polymerase sigma factor (sigma-70 family)
MDQVDQRVAPGPVTFDDLFRRERTGMVRLAYLITRSTAVAEEVTHDAFVEVYERWSRLDRPGAYLRRCVVNRAIRHNRRRDRDPSLSVVRDDSAPAYDHTLDAVGRLPAQARAMVVLRYYASMSQQEIADVLGIPVGTVKSGLHRALAQLKQVIS